ncbi:MAG: GAF domain-containing protein [Candidatus Onthomonas sp.]
MEDTKLDRLTEPYQMLTEQLKALLTDERNLITGLANAAALLYEALEGVNWAGFYLRQGGQLVLGPFQGKMACTRIPLGKGVCGTAAALDKIQRVPDVHAFPGHIACDSASRSEIVLPLHWKGAVAAVLDIDSPRTDRFGPEDEAGLLQCAGVLERLFGAVERNVTLFWTEERG